jgi:hypothetical protein
MLLQAVVSKSFISSCFNSCHLRPAVYTRHAIPFGHGYLHSLKFKEETVLMTAGGGAGDVDSSSSDDEATTEASIAKAMIEENYYEILGLGEYGCNATDDQIRKACKVFPQVPQGLSRDG